MGDRITYVGLDVHKAEIVVAAAAGGLRGEVREYGRIANTPAALARLARQLSRDGVRLRFCSEPGPCGYGIQRQLSGLGHECVVVAPSLIPKVLAWLSRHRRWIFQFTQTAASWLNAVENFFSKMTRQRIRRGVFRSTVDLPSAINAYLAEYNVHPQPFVWTQSANASSPNSTACLYSPNASEH